jgi:hypothetical protein
MVRKRMLLVFGVVVLALGLAAPLTGATASPRRPSANPRPAIASTSTAHGPRVADTAFAPGIGASWAGVTDFSLSPPDPNGAIGPNSYIEIINVQLGIYNRSGGLITSGSLRTLTGHTGSIGDPMILWDADTQRFYYNVWDIGQSTMAWGFSKDNNPTTIPGSFCNYTASFGYTTSEFPDYPKLGQTKRFLLIGVNHYPSLSAPHADRSDVLWITKPQGTGPVTTCPASTTFNTGKFVNIRNQDGTQAFTPVPAIQIDPQVNGFVLSSTDIECPDICGTGNKITVHAVRPTPGNPMVPQMLVTGKSITVPTYTSLDAINTGAPQQGTTDVLSTLDGRLEHAVAAIDPTINKVVIWTGHSVKSAANRSEFRWYEINPLPINAPTVVQSGVVNDASLWVFNGAMSSDRACDLAGCTHGDSIVIGFTTSSSTTFPAVQMVSKIGAGAQSAFVMVHQATTFDNDFTCAPVCRWGDYGGATPDPTKKGGTHGEVWLTQDTTNGLNITWNWEALP